MKNDVNLELDLGEDQLQDITGGCQQCQQNLSRIDQHHAFIDQYTTAAAEARERGDNALAEQHLGFATQHARQVQALLQAVADKHPVVPR